jgi:hypothetical protein
MIRKIIVEMNDAEATFREFNSLAELEASDLYAQEKNIPVEVTPVETTVEPTPEIPVIPETPVTPTT